MKKLVLLFLANFLFSFEMKYIADPNFCIRTQQPLQTCNFALEFMNLMEIINLSNKLGDKDKETLKSKARMTIEKMCFFWGMMPPQSKNFIYTQSTHDGGIAVTKEDMINLCIKGDYK